MSRPKRLRSAVIGTGFVGPHHVDAIQRGGYAQVDLLVDRDPERGPRIAASLGVPRAVTSLDEVLADATIDVVHVCTPNWTHVDLARAAMEAGKHVVVEKPIAVDRAGASALLEVARRTGVHAATALTYRGYPMVRQAREMVAAGRLGPMRLIHGAYLQDWLSEATDYNWRVDAAAGGGSRAFADIGTHWFDTVEFIGGLQATAVMAELATLVPIRQRPTTVAAAFSAGTGPTEPITIDTEDAGAVLVRFEGGARGSVIVSQVSPGHRNHLEVELSGTDASLRWEQERPERLWLGSRRESFELSRAPSEPSWPVGVPSLPAGHPEGWGEALRDVLRPFYAGIASGQPPPTEAAAAYPTLGDGARGVALIEAVMESSMKGAWVDIRPI